MQVRAWGIYGSNNSTRALSEAMVRLPKSPYRRFGEGAGIARHFPTLKTIVYIVSVGGLLRFPHNSVFMCVLVCIANRLWF